jgi:ABC-type bacteriocin/lantibiotic exporter with double-glycine peptidase domain
MNKPCFKHMGWIKRVPRVLAPDEAIRHLDVTAAHAIMHVLAQLPLTRLVAARSPDTLAGAQRVVQLQGGLVSELGHAGQREA